MTAASSSASDRYVAFDLSERTKLRLTGADRQRYLNGQITNDVRKASADAAIYAAILNAKGRINADVFISLADDAFLLDAEAGLREALPARLDRYIIADDVQLEDVTDAFALFHFVGETAPVISDRTKFVRAHRFGVCGFDLWVTMEERERLLQQLRSTMDVVSADSAEAFRIERGVPRWGYELTDEIIPVEANLEAVAIDYEKGCYIGQEVISRMKMSGQTNKRLFGLTSVSGEPLRAGMRLTSAAIEGREAGWITSATRSERLGKEIALGFVKRGFGGVGARLQALSPGNASGESMTVEIVDVPFR